MPHKSRAFRSSKDFHSERTEEILDMIDWELRPGGMLVQRRNPASNSSPSSGALIKVKVSHGQYQHDITVPAQATFGDLKWLLVQEIGLQPNEQRLLFRGKEKENTDCLHIAGVKDQAKIILVEDPASREKKLDEIKRDEGIAKACHAVSLVREEVNILAGQVSALEVVVNSGSKVADNDFTLLSEFLMRQLLKLDSIEADGEAKVQRRVQVRRVQNFVDIIDGLKARNNNPICKNAAVVTTQWDTFDSGMGSLIAPPPATASTVATNWELFD